MKSIKAAISRTEQELARKFKSILSTKGFGKSHRDVTVLDTSKDKKSSWAISPNTFQSYRLVASLGSRSLSPYFV
jgi:hypothetical protein